MRLACWQAAVAEGDGAEPLARLATVARQARDAGADVLVTPELSLTGYRAGVLGVPRPEHRLDELVDRATRIAADAGVAVVFGCPERTPHGVHNTARLVDRRGEVVVSYRKAHLYESAERSAFTAGAECVAQGRLGDLTVGLLICYDIEFPEPARAHALRGTDVLVVPTALYQPWEFVPTTLVPARAFENQFYLAYANWSGQDGPARYCGLSRVVDPHGRVTSAPETGDHLLVTDVDPAAVRAARAATPYLADRRPGLYQDLTDPVDRQHGRRGDP